MATTSNTSRKSGLLLMAGLLPCIASTVFTSKVDEALPLVTTKSRPSLVFSPYLYHHGEDPVALDATLYSEFQFRNDGEQVVTIGEIERSCGCLSPRLSKRQVAPGAIESLIVPLQTIRQAPGPHEYTLTVHYTDPEPRKATLSIKATFPKKMVTVQPTALYLSQSTDKSVPFQVAVSDYRDKTLNVTGVEATAWFVSANIGTSSESKIVQASYSLESPDEELYLPAAQTTIKGEVAGGVPRGHHDVVITATTDDPEFPMVTVPMVVNGPPHPPGEAPIATPRQIAMFASDQPGAKRSQTVQVVMPATWQVSHAASWPEELNVEFDEGKAISDTQTMVTMQVNLKQLPAAKTEHGVVQLIANEGKDLVTVKVMFYWP